MKSLTNKIEKQPVISIDWGGRPTLSIEQHVWLRVWIQVRRQVQSRIYEKLNP